MSTGTLSYSKRTVNMMSLGVVLLVVSEGLHLATGHWMAGVVTIVIAILLLLLLTKTTTVETHSCSCDSEEPQPSTTTASSTPVKPQQLLSLSQMDRSSSDKLTFV